MMKNLEFKIKTKINLSNPDCGISYMYTNLCIEKQSAIMERWKEWRGTYDYYGQWKNFGTNHNGIWLAKKSGRV